MILISAPAGLLETVLVVVLVVVVTVVASASLESLASQDDRARVGSPVSAVGALVSRHNI